MNSIKLLDRRRVAYVIAAFMVVFATIVPAIASAAQATNRSVELSSSSAGADNVTYNVKFKAVDVAGAFVLEFCQNSPIVGQACTPATGFTAADAATATSGYTITNKDATKVFVTSAITAGEDVEVALTDIDNPDAAGPLYARVVTYADATAASGYASAAPGTHVDDGGMAISITSSVGVQGAVLETITFCVSGTTLTANCGNVNSTALPLGETVGTTKALTPGVISEGKIYTQISTNALGGAIVNLKSSTLGCGGLKRAGATTCDIAPALTSGISASANEAKFGVKVGSLSDTGVNPSGTFQATNSYNASTYTLNFTANDTAGVTSVYGDPILNTNNAPANNKNAELTFGATVSNTTPAGVYSADLSMIATGKF